MWCQSPVVRYYLCKRVFNKLKWQGGIAKFPEMDFADPVHTLHSLFGLAINK